MVFAVKEKQNNKKKISTCAEMLLQQTVLVTVQQSVAAHSCLLFTFPSKQVSIEGGIDKACMCVQYFSLPLPSPPPPSSLAQPLLFSMCNLKLICTTGYLTGATDTGSVLFLLKHSMELTLNLNKNNPKLKTMPNATATLTLVTVEREVQAEQVAGRSETEGESWWLELN